MNSRAFCFGFSLCATPENFFREKSVQRTATLEADDSFILNLPQIIICCGSIFVGIPLSVLQMTSHGYERHFVGENQLCPMRLSPVLRRGDNRQFQRVESVPAVLQPWHRAAASQIWR